MPVFPASVLGGRYDVTRPSSTRADINSGQSSCLISPAGGRSAGTVRSFSERPTRSSMSVPRPFYSSLFLISFRGIRARSGDVSATNRQRRTGQAGTTADRGGERYDEEQNGNPKYWLWPRSRDGRSSGALLGKSGRASERTNARIYTRAIRNGYILRYLQPAALRSREASVVCSPTDIRWHAATALFLQPWRVTTSSLIR